MANMLAAVIDGVRQVDVRETPKPEPKRGEVLVEVRACGICLTDYSAYTGARMNWEPPLIAGHEMSGTVAETGEGVTHWRPGDDVVISPVVSCGRCRNCLLGLQHYCASGIVLGGDGQDTVWDGGFAQYINVPESTLYKKPSNVSFESAALTEPLAGSYKGVIEYTDITIGEDMVLLGAGSMGLLVLQLAAGAGAGTLVAVDLSDFRLDKARELGATHAINASKEDAEARVAALLPDGPDIVFEAAGSLEAAQLTFDLMRKGSRMNMFGVIIPGNVQAEPRRLHFQETRMDASFSVNPRVMQRSLDLQAKGLVAPDRIVTHRYPLEDIEQAFAAMEEPDRIKIMVHPNGPATA
jgi:NADPH2:quinone reductase